MKRLYQALTMRVKKAFSLFASGQDVVNGRPVQEFYPEAERLCFLQEFAKVSWMIAEASPHTTSPAKIQNWNKVIQKHLIKLEKFFQDEGLNCQIVSGSKTQFDQIANDKKENVDQYYEQVCRLFSVLAEQIAEETNTNL